ncbi:MAG TPA: FliM/FliN family flagellar motor switch protein [Thermoguttaceae bacterium]|nr:FliM/FliN family flagellar motor switch protein [Thermoguttaceae bacterium]
MAELSLDIVSEVVESCKAGAEEAAVALGRGLDTEVRLSVGEPGSIDVQSLPEGFTGPGLAVVLTVGSTGALVLVPESSGLLPPWYGEPDPTGESKLATLAQELGATLLPEEYMPGDFKAARVGSLTDALTRGGVSDGAASLPLELERPEGTRATAHLIWPALSPAAVIAQEAIPEAAPQEAAPQEAETEPQEKPPAQPPSRPQSAAGAKQSGRRQGVTLNDLPNYSRSLLQIKLPVVVTLARKRQPVGQILKLGPGSIIQFDKSCEETLELEVGERSIATGEAVKVGDKFGLRINSMILPEERFTPVRKG